MVLKKYKRNKKIVSHLRLQHTKLVDTNHKANIVVLVM